MFLQYVQCWVKITKLIKKKIYEDGEVNEEKERVFLTEKKFKKKSDAKKDRLQLTGRNSDIPRKSKVREKMVGSSREGKTRKKSGRAAIDSRRGGEDSLGSRGKKLGNEKKTCWYDIGGGGHTGKGKWRREPRRDR